MRTRGEHPRRTVEENTERTQGEQSRRTIAPEKLASTPRNRPNERHSTDAIETTRVHSEQPISIEKDHPENDMSDSRTGTQHKDQNAQDQQ